MSLPPWLDQAIQKQLHGVSMDRLRPAYEALSAEYHGKGAGSHRDKWLAYAAGRLPATFAAMDAALSMAPQAFENASSAIDFGCGPGTASWALAQRLPGLTRLTMVEKDADAAQLGKTLGQELPGEVRQVWKSVDLTRRIQGIDAHDVVLLSYVLNELREEQAEVLAKQAWDLTRDCLVIVEPGTPGAFQRLLKLRSFLINKGALLAAPCAHSLPCPLRGGTPWCHFSTRLARSRLHRQMKGAEAPFEDEKFLCLIFTRQPQPAFGARVIGQPRKEKLGIRLELCAPDGKAKALRVGKKESSEARLAARRAGWGSVWDTATDQGPLKGSA